MSSLRKKLSTWRLGTREPYTESPDLEIGRKSLDSGHASMSQQSSHHLNQGSLSNPNESDPPVLSTRRLRKTLSTTFEVLAATSRGVVEHFHQEPKKTDSDVETGNAFDCRTPNASPSKENVNYGSVRKSLMSSVRGRKRASGFSFSHLLPSEDGGPEPPVTPTKIDEVRGGSPKRDIDKNHSIRKFLTSSVRGRKRAGTTDSMAMQDPEGEDAVSSGAAHQRSTEYAPKLDLDFPTPPNDDGREDVFSDCGAMSMMMGIQAPVAQANLLFPPIHPTATSLDIQKTDDLGSATPTPSAHATQLIRSCEDKGYVADIESDAENTDLGNISTGQSKAVAPVLTEPITPSPSGSSHLDPKVDLGGDPLDASTWKASLPLRRKASQSPLRTDKHRDHAVSINNSNDSDMSRSCPIAFPSMGSRMIFDQIRQERSTRYNAIVGEEMKEVELQAGSSPPDSPIPWVSLNHTSGGERSVGNVNIRQICGTRMLKPRLSSDLLMVEAADRKSGDDLMTEDRNNRRDESSENLCNEDISQRIGSEVSSLASSRKSSALSTIDLDSRSTVSGTPPASRWERSRAASGLNKATTDGSSSSQTSVSGDTATPMPASYPGTASPSPILDARTPDIEQGAAITSGSRACSTISWSSPATCWEHSRVASGPSTDGWPCLQRSLPSRAATPVPASYSGPATPSPNLGTRIIDNVQEAKITIEKQRNVNHAVGASPLRRTPTSKFRVPLSSTSGNKAAPELPSNKEGKSPRGQVFEKARQFRASPNKSPGNALTPPQFGIQAFQSPHTPNSSYMGHELEPASCGNVRSERITRSLPTRSTQEPIDYIPIISPGGSVRRGKPQISSPQGSPLSRKASRAALKAKKRASKQQLKQERIIPIEYYIKKDDDEELLDDDANVDDSDEDDDDGENGVLIQERPRWCVPGVPASVAL